MISFYGKRTCVCFVRLPEVFYYGPHVIEDAGRFN